MRERGTAGRRRPRRTEAQPWSFAEDAELRATHASNAELPHGLELRFQHGSRCRRWESTGPGARGASRRLLDADHLCFPGLDGLRSESLGCLLLQRRLPEFQALRSKQPNRPGSLRRLLASSPPQPRHAPYPPCRRTLLQLRPGRDGPRLQRLRPRAVAHRARPGLRCRARGAAPGA